MPAVLTNLFYFDAVIDLVFVRAGAGCSAGSSAACSTRT